MLNESFIIFNALRWSHKLSMRELFLPDNQLTAPKMEQWNYLQRSFLSIFFFLLLQFTDSGLKKRGRAEEDCLKRWLFFSFFLSSFWSPKLLKRNRLMAQLVTISFRLPLLQSGFQNDNIGVLLDLQTFFRLSSELFGHFKDF